MQISRDGVEIKWVDGAKLFLTLGAGYKGRVRGACGDYCEPIEYKAVTKRSVDVEGSAVERREKREASDVTDEVNNGIIGDDDVTTLQSTHNEHTELPQHLEESDQTETPHVSEVQERNETLLNSEEVEYTEATNGTIESEHTETPDDTAETEHNEGSIEATSKSPAVANAENSENSSGPDIQTTTMTKLELHNLHNSVFSGNGTLEAEILSLLEGSVNDNESLLSGEETVSAQLICRAYFFF